MYGKFSKSQISARLGRAILGDGVFGFLHAMLAKIYGARKIIVSGHYDSRLNRIAKETNAITCNTHKQNLNEVLERYIANSALTLPSNAQAQAQRRTSL
jgi:threonine dehydrogenase-like Zn-dependent dehydrogenase